jgi:uncharacterized membrane-anchored protein
MKKYLILLFILVALVQWYIPGKMMWNREEVLRKGKVFRFQTEPVDPEDPFRGRYVHLAYKADTAMAKADSFKEGEKVYAEIENDAAGFVKLKQLHKQPPASKDYVEAKIYYWLYEDPNSNGPRKVIISYPFEQFFLDEYKAPKAETLYNTARWDTTGQTYALVSIYKGRGVIKDLMINDKPVHSYFK